MPSFRKSLLALLALAGLGLGACGKEDATSLLVLVNTDYRVGEEMARVRISLTAPGDRSEIWSEQDLDVVPADPAAGQFLVPLTFAVVPGRGRGKDQVRIEVVGLDPTGTVLVRRSARVAFVPGESRLLPMFLARVCAGVTCEQDETCVLGGCRSEELDPDDLPQVDDPTDACPNGQLPFWPDADMDGYGDASSLPTYACVPPMGFVGNDGDCDDDDSSVRPAIGVVEVEDGADDDCDGIVDEGVFTMGLTCWADADADGFALATAGTLVAAGSCPTNWTEAEPVGGAVDCDDGDATLYPGAPEVCDRQFSDCDSGMAGEPRLAEDMDGDGFAAPAAPCIDSAEFPKTDCADDDPQRAFCAPIRHDATTTLGGAVSVQAFDIDADGDLDLVAAGNVDDDVVWLENTDGVGASWTTRTIDASLNGVQSVWAADLDGDTDLDVMAAAATANDVTWWENRLDLGMTWLEHPVDTSYQGARSIRAADIDRDGDLDLVTAADQLGRISWWENISGDGLSFTERTIDGSLADAYEVVVGDVDRDGSPDVVAASNSLGVYWYDNQNGDGSSFVRTPVDTTIGLAFSVATADVDGDGDRDILATGWSDDIVSWWENLDGIGGSFTEHPIADGTFDTAESVFATDIDGDGDVDVAGAAFTPDEIVWWENLGTGGSFVEHVVAPGDFNGAEWVVVADVDGDGDQDFVGAALGSGSITWWENFGGPFTPGP